MYRTVAQIDSATSILSTWFPQLFTRVQLPEASVQGRPVYALRMRAGSGTGRRGVLIVGGTHARELMNPGRHHRARNRPAAELFERNQHPLWRQDVHGR